VTPKSIRLRKKLLDSNARKRADRAAEAEVGGCANSHAPGYPRAKENG
jgi:hypothetical protein